MQGNVRDQRKNKAMLAILYKEGGSVKFKDESLFMKIIGLLLFFNKRFMTEFTTTIGSTVYLPSRKSLDNELLWVTIGHELIHVRDRKKDVWWFPSLYLFPQSYGAVILLAALVSLVHYDMSVGRTLLVFLPAVFLLSPVPSPFRAMYEARAYAMTLLLLSLHARAEDIATGKVDVRDLPCEIPEWVDRVFTGSAYYYMARKGSSYRRDIEYFFSGYAWSKWGGAARGEMTYRYGYIVQDIVDISLGVYVDKENKDVEALFR